MHHQPSRAKSGEVQPHPRTHYDPATGARHYACNIGCAAVQEAVDRIAGHLADCQYIRLLHDGDNSLIELWTRAQTAGISHTPSTGRAVPEAVTLDLVVDRLFAPTRRNLELLFAAITDLSLLDVVAIHPRRVTTLVDQFDLAVTVVDDEEDDEDQWGNDAGELGETSTA